jgi:hypothetical protein
VYRNHSIAHQQKLVLKGTDRCDCDSPAIDAGVCATVDKSQDVRCLPSFIIIGAMKSGTGELMKWLQWHPLLRVSANDATGACCVFFFCNDFFS